MKYINTKTRVTLETDNAVSGGNWVLIDDYKNNKEEKIEEKVEEVEEVEVKEEVKNAPDEITVAEIKNELDALGIEYSNKARKDNLWNLLQSNI